MAAFGVPSVEGDNREPGSCGWQLPGFCAEGRQTWERLFPHRNPLVARKLELEVPLVLHLGEEQCDPFGCNRRVYAGDVYGGREFLVAT